IYPRRGGHYLCPMRYGKHVHTDFAPRAQRWCPPCHNVVHSGDVELWCLRAAVFRGEGVRAMTSGLKLSAPLDNQEVIPVAIAALSVTDSPRIGGVDPEHLRLLAE